MGILDTPAYSRAAADAKFSTPATVTAQLAATPTAANAAAAAVQNAMASQYLSYALVAGYASTALSFTAYAGTPTYTTPAKFTASFGGGSVSKTGITEPTVSWTVECWVYAAAPHTGTVNPKVIWGNGSSWLGAMPDTGYAVWCQGSADNTRRISTVNIADGQWHHIAVQFQRISGITTPQGFYIDGVLLADAGTTAALSWVTTFYVGGMGSSALDWHGRIDEFRISTVKRYAANFTPPATEYVFDPSTYVLAHLSNNQYLTPGGTGYPARPVGAPGGAVTYTGPIQPTDWITGDKWVQQ